MPDRAFISAIKDKELHHAVRARLLDLEVYPHAFMVGKAAWQYGAEYLAQFPKVLEADLPPYEQTFIERPSAGTRGFKTLK